MGDGTEAQRSTLSRREFLAAGAGAMGMLAGSGLGHAAERRRRRPNFVVIFTDDQGYQDLGCFGSPTIATPHIDRMAAEGMRFTDFYVASPICTPSRAALMTGCYPKRVGLAEGVIFPDHDHGLHPDEITLAEVLKDRGYATACIGKWHLGHREPFLPTRQGFDRYFGIPYSNDMHRPIDGRPGPPLMRGDQIVELPAEQATLTERYTEEAVTFIRQNRDRPFFLYLPHSMPHLPLHVSERFKGKSEGGLYGDVIECIDWSTGRIRQTLEEQGLAEETIVVFTSDNGPWTQRRDGQNVGFTSPLRGSKNTTYEGGLRVPCVMWAPGRIPPGHVCEQVATSMDLHPTFARLAEAELPNDPAIDGRDIWPLMAGRRGADSPHEAFYYYSGRGQLEAVRRGVWKLRRADDEPELYHLREDVGEQTNRAREHPDMVRELTAMMGAFDDELTQNARPVGRL